MTGLLALRVTIAIFYGLQISATAYAFWRGGAPERIVGAALLVAAITTTLLPHPHGPYRSVYWPEVWVDGALLIVLVAVALFADRFWPMWLASLHLLGVMMHGVRGYDPNLIWAAYWFLTGKLAYPILIVLIAGTYRHAHRRRAGLPEHDWTRQRIRHR